MDGDRLLTTPGRAGMKSIATLASEIGGLRRELQITWDAHAREHKQHDLSHAREHEFAQEALEKAASVAAENKADANEWRSAMTDREAKFATKDDMKALLVRLDAIERALLVSDERARAKAQSEVEDKLDADRRISRSQWLIGLIVGVMATVAAVLINLVLRLSN
jgi:hypothetical protein